MKPAKLPEYDRPPAIETLMGFHFAPLPNWNVLRLGQAWASFKADYPVSNAIPAMGDANAVSQMMISDPGQLPFRAMFSKADGSELLQLQSSAFLRNWRRTADNQQYTHYAQLRPRFKIDWEIFLGFLADNQFQPPTIFQCEVTYVNHLVRGTDWDSYTDIAKSIKFFAPRREQVKDGRLYDYLPEAANVGLSVGYGFKESGLSLQFLAHSAVTMPEGSEVLQLTITAKGSPKGNLETGLFEMLDECHDAVIRGFDDATTEFAHEKWGKR